MTELRPCPFCGGEVKLVNEFDCVLVVCKNCDTTIGIGGYESKQEVTRAWNKRPNPWHTGKPSEEGWYLLKLNHDGETKYDANYLWDIGFGKEWKYAYLGEVVKWQKIEENEDGRTD